MQGLPIGHGEVWHDPAQRRLLICLAALAFLPFLGLMLPGWGLVSLETYLTWLVAPVAGLITGIAAFSWQRYPMLSRRVSVGLLGGLLGALTYDTMRLVAKGYGWFSAGNALGVSASPPVNLVVWGEGTLIRWVVMGALGGLAYALVAGKARWGYGLAYGFGLAALLLTGAWLAPHGGLVMPPHTLAGLAGWLAGSLVFGAVLGSLNEALQPDIRRGAKIIFLRDYQTRVGTRK